MEIDVGVNVDSLDVDLGVNVNAYPLFPACPNAEMICEMIDSSVMRGSGGRRRISGVVCRSMRHPGGIKIASYIARCYHGQRVRVGDAAHEDETGRSPTGVSFAICS